jgi:flagellar biogenesis protein FliO
LLCLSARAESAPTDKDSDEAIMAAAEKLVGEGKMLKTEEVKSEPASEAADASAAGKNAEATPAVTGQALEAKKESEIPVFTKSEKVAKSETSLVWRLIASMALLGVVGGSMIYATKRYTRKKNTGGEKVRIEMLHKFSLSPKNSLALVRVAGEVMLIGCTDHNINMIKSVTLIDDELEGLLGKDFNGFLEDDFKIEDMRSALQPRV